MIKAEVLRACGYGPAGVALLRLCLDHERYLLEAAVLGVGREVALRLLREEGLAAQASGQRRDALRCAKRRLIEMA